jgi:phytoene synthase
LPAVCGRIAREAESHFAAAEAAMARCDRRAMRPARIMAATYRAVLAALQRRGWSRPAETVRVPAWRKVLIAARYAVA